MSKKTIDITSVISQRIINNAPGSRGWFHTMPQDAQKVLGKFRDDYRAGRVAGQKKAIARAVIEVAAEQGWKTSGIQGVIAWLDEKPT